MADPVQPRFWNVPNSLTMLRLVLSIVVFACIAQGQYYPALVIFGLASLTDALDGYFARLLGQATAIGRQLDPMVDKIFVAGAFIFLLAVPGSGLAPWMVTVIVVRELLIQGLRSLLEGQGQAFGARWSGKVKTALQCVAIAAILLSLATQPTPGWLQVRDILTWSAVALTLYSGVVYLVVGWGKLHEPVPPTSHS